MNKNISVDDAIKKGHQVITYPIRILFFVFSLATFYTLFRNQSSVLLILGMIISIPVLPMLYSSMIVPKWKIWAFGNIRNVHELKKRAILEEIISPSNSFSAKTEIWTKKDKAKWKALQIKFLSDDVFIDDPTVGTETIIYYSKLKDPIGITNEESAQVIINEIGIYTAFTGFYPWDQISDEYIHCNYGHRFKSYFLRYQHPKGLRSLPIDKLNISPIELLQLLTIYRGRHNSKNNPA